MSQHKQVLADFTDPAVGTVAAAQSLQFQQDAQGLALSLRAEGRDSLVLAIPEAIAVSDWTTFDTLAVELSNPEDRELQLSVILRAESLQQTADADWDGKARFDACIAPATRATWRIPLQQLRYGTKTFEWPGGYHPLQPGISDFDSRFGVVNTHAVVEVAIALRRPENETLPARRLVLHRMGLENPIPSRGWVDPYGQRRNMKWPGKVKTDADLKRADRNEQKKLARLHIPDRDEYQAWKNGPTLEATGFFRSELVDERWWLVAPNGRLYYAVGLDCVGIGAEARVDDLVLQAHGWLPDKEGPLAKAWTGPFRQSEREGFSLYRANLIRKWGPDEFAVKGRARAQERQLAWGFTCLGNWTDARILQTPMLPYFTMGPDTSGMTVPAVGGLMDVYHPDFETQARAAASMLAPVKTDPLVVGHFIQNELPWRGLPEALFGLPAEQPARAALTRFLQARYWNIAGLNAAWGAQAGSFKALAWPDAASPRAQSDLAAFRAEFAERYYRVWAKAMREADPNHLLMGSRMHGRSGPDEVVAACARHMDVVSYNIYDIGPDPEEFDRLYAITRKPVLIGEYGFNSLDQGLLQSAVPVADQAERGVGYRYYTEQMAALSYLVGTHYFQYLDEPITGRFDRECAFNGFVRVTDIPYPKLVQAARTTNARIYPVHAGRQRPFAATPRR